MPTRSNQGLRSFRALLLVLTPLVTASDLAESKDWAQWRGAGRDGVVLESPRLASSWPTEGPPFLWQSEPFPTRSGEGSVVVSGEGVFIFLNCQESENITERKLEDRALRRIGWFDAGDVPAAVLSAAEKARKAVPTNLRGPALNEHAKAWIEKNIGDDRNLRKSRGALERRIKEGAEAAPLDLLARLTRGKDREFPNQAALDRWFEENRIGEPWRSRVQKGITTSRPIGYDLVLCLDRQTGKTRWKRRLPGKPRGNDASSTPCIADDRLYVTGSTHAHCLDARTGEPIWATELPVGASPSSFVLTKRAAIVVAGELTSFSRADGKIRWTQKRVRGRRSSPSIWRTNGKEYVITSDDQREVWCVDTENGQVIWSVKGAGIASIVLSGDAMVVHSSDKDRWLSAYELTLDGPRNTWTRKSEERGRVRGAASPIVHEGLVYLAGSERFACYDLATGKPHWEEKARAEISSPLLVDGKIISVTGNGGFLSLVEATTAEFRELAKVRIRAARCPSPAFSGGLLFLKKTDHIASYDLRESTKPAP